MKVGANIPASDPFRLTPLLLAKLKMDNLLQHRRSTDNKEWVSECAKQEYSDLLSANHSSVSDSLGKQTFIICFFSYRTS
ncbi:hypothetical protein G6F57_021937 [Rhizopus arrhizus]|nr:hypothetical protein G6F57_021937 [Rhizopus arrhizus]